MKRILFFALAISMLLGVTSCGGDGSEETSEISSSAVSESQSSIAEESSEEASSEASSEEVTEKEYDTLDKTNLRKEFTTDEFLIGSWVSFYSFEKDSFETQLDNMKALGLNFNIYPSILAEKWIWIQLLPLNKNTAKEICIILCLAEWICPRSISIQTALLGWSIASVTILLMSHL
jgi:hypothetical protein